jgi:hypothetical protein
MDRPVTTLFMLVSVDGKISTGSTDNMDVDKDLPMIEGVREGLHQYYEIEQTTDLWSFNTGRVQAKMGVNEKPVPCKTPVSFVILDNHHLTERGVHYFCEFSKEFVTLKPIPKFLTQFGQAHFYFSFLSAFLGFFFCESTDLSAFFVSPSSGRFLADFGTLTALIRTSPRMFFVDVSSATLSSLTSTPGRGYLSPAR